MGVVKRYFKPLFTAAPTILWSYLSWMKRYSFRSCKTTLEKRYLKVRNLFKKVNKYLDVDLIVEGLENIPHDVNVCFVGNHISDYDAVAVLSLIEEPTTFVGKIEIKKYPFISTIIKDLNGALIDRSNLKSTLKVMMRVQKEMMTLRKNWIIFPEGTRRKDSMMTMLDFHSGTFRTPMKAGVTIVPFAIIGTDRVLKGSPIYKKYPVHVKFLPALTKSYYIDKTTEDIAKQCYDDIQKTISFDLRYKDFESISKIAIKK